MRRASLHMSEKPALCCNVTPLASFSRPIRRVTCHVGRRVAHWRHVRVSRWAYQRRNVLSRVHVHVPCERTDKRAMTNCQISVPTFTHSSLQNTSCYRTFRVHNCTAILCWMSSTKTVVKTAPSPPHPY